MLNAVVLLALTVVDAMDAAKEAERGGDPAKATAMRELADACADQLRQMRRYDA